MSKVAQKESRNVLSNLLRILFKNILEVRMYEDLISKIIGINRFNTTVEEFYLCLETYGINYKNYIRFNSVKRIMVQSITWVSRELRQWVALPLLFPRSSGG